MSQHHPIQLRAKVEGKDRKAVKSTKKAKPIHFVALAAERLEDDYVLKDCFFRDLASISEFRRKVSRNNL